MKYSVIRASTSRLLKEDDAGQYLGVPVLLEMMLKAGWIKPVVDRRKMRLFDINQLDQCCDRLALGDFPATGGAES